MAETREIKIVVSADGSAAITGIRTVGAETDRLGQKTLSMSEQFKKNWAAISAGAVGVYYSLQKIWGSMEDSANLMEKMNLLNTYTQQYGETAEGLVGKISQVSRGLIGTRAAAEVATDAISKGFTPEQITNMAKYAEVMAKNSSETMTTAQAFRKMEESLVAARERGAVKFFGAMLDVKSALGDNYEMMTKAEKAQAIYNLAMKLGAERAAAAGEMTDSAADRMERFTNAVNQAKFFFGQFLLILGQPLMAIINTALSMIFLLISSLYSFASAIGTITDAVGITTGKADEWSKRSDEWITRSIAQGEMAIDNWKGAGQAVMDFGKYVTENRKGGPLPSFEDADASQKKIDKLQDLYQKYLDERLALQAPELDREIYNTNKWLHEQESALKKAGAGQREYAELTALYNVKIAKAIAERDKKVIETETAYWKKQNEEYLKGVTERIAMESAFLEMQAKVIADRQYNLAKTLGASESSLIKLKTDGELAILAVQEQRIKQQWEALSEEGMKAEDFLRLRKELEDVERRRVELIEYETTDLLTRQLEIARELTALDEMQVALIREQNLARMESAFQKLGPEGSAFGAGAADVASLAGGMENIYKGTDVYSQDFQRWAEMQNQRIALLREQGWNEIDLLDEYRAIELQKEQAHQNQKIEMASTGFGMMANLATAFYNASGQKSLAAFRVMQAMRIAETVMDTYKAAVAAYSAMAGIPIVGPALGAAAAAAAIAFGMMQVRNIASAKPGGASSSSVSVPSSGTGVAYPTATSAPAAVEESRPYTPTVNIHVYGNIVDQDAFAREMVPAITKAIEDGVR